MNSQTAQKVTDYNGVEKIVRNHLSAHMDSLTSRRLAQVVNIIVDGPYQYAIRGEAAEEARAILFGKLLPSHDTSSSLMESIYEDLNREDELPLTWR